MKKFRQLELEERLLSDKCLGCDDKSAGTRSLATPSVSQDRVESVGPLHAGQQAVGLYG